MEGLTTQHERGTLLWMDASKRQVREVLMRNGISSSTWLIAHGLFLDPEWDGGPNLYIIDTLTDKGARVTIQGPDEFDVKVSSRTGEALLADLVDQMPALLDKIVIID
jgi:hypothetical protein